MKIDRNKLSKLKFNELVSLKTIVNDIVTELSNNLTDYAMMSNDVDFQNMDELKKKEYSRLILFQNLLSVIKENIINKTIEDYFNE
jgi:hypothetical protein